MTSQKNKQKFNLTVLIQFQQKKRQTETLNYKLLDLYNTLTPTSLGIIK